MVFLLRQILRYSAQKLANDPAVREKATKVARKAAGEAGKIARDEDPARAAGRAVRRALNKFERR